MTDEPLYNIGVVTRLTGVPVATLHAWERRYGFPQSARTSGGHRLYSEKDIARLRWVKAQVDSGMTVSRAIAAVRALESEGRLFLPAAPEVAARPVPETTSSHSLRDALVEALISHDLSRADHMMGDMLAFYSPEALTTEIIGPALAEIGRLWEERRITVATEHLASNYLRHRLLMWMVTGPPPKPVNPIVLACAPEEWHEGSLLMLGVLLRRKGWPVAYLGQNVPFPDLADFVRQIHPPLVILVAIREETARHLSEWPRWIVQAGGKPIVAFGGRAFVVNPALQALVAGLYLGNTIQEAMNRLENLLSQA
ncbi:MAG: MerR family transcriptional regulator [Anaerolineales bacterium]|nr:MerR family transcriptional regulator [Anaerolineales bacterium]